MLLWGPHDWLAHRKLELPCCLWEGYVWIVSGKLAARRSCVGSYFATEGVDKHMSSGHTLQVVDGNPSKHALVFATDDVCIGWLESAARTAHQNGTLPNDPGEYR